MSRIPIIQVITHLPQGGAQRVLLTLAEKLDRERFVCHIVAGPRGGWLGMAKNIKGAFFHPAENLIREISPMRDAMVVPELVSIFKKIQNYSPHTPAIVHTHAPKAGVAGRIAAKIAGLKNVHTLHGLPFNINQSRFKRGAYTLFESIGYYAGGDLISVTKTNIDWAVRRKLVKENQARLIRPSVDLDTLIANRKKRKNNKLLKQFGIYQNKTIIGFIASLKPPKDPFVFLEAANTLINKHKDLHFIVAGDGEYKAGLEKKAAEFGISKQISFIGWFDPIEELYPELDILVLTTNSEGLPLTLVEARASAVPVIASNVGGVSEIITHNKTGLLIKPGSVRELVESVEKLLDDKDFRMQIITNGTQNLEEYHPDYMVKAHQELYLEIAGES